MSRKKSTSEKCLPILSQKSRRSGGQSSDITVRCGLNFFSDLFQMPSLKHFSDSPAYQPVFIKQALKDGIRLDGRSLSEYREVTVSFQVFLFHNIYKLRHTSN